MTDYITQIQSEDVDICQLSREAQGVSGLSCIVSGGGYVIARFQQEPSQQQIDDFDSIVAAHTAGSLRVKLWRYIEGHHETSCLEPPSDVDYITGLSSRLHPTNSVIVDGEVRQTDYYAQATMNQQTGQVSYSDLVIRESFTYQRDAVGFARARTQVISWYREDGSAHPATKTRFKLYEPDESLREGQRRRRNITDKLAMDLSWWLIATQTHLQNPQHRIDLGRNFMRHHKLSFDMFAEASSAQILYDIRDDEVSDHATWIDDEISAGATIRQTVLDALNIWNITL